MIAALALAAALLDPAQQAALQARFPHARIVSSCAGNFSGGAAQELVLEVMTGPEQLERAGLVYAKGGWLAHRIDVELERDRAVSHSSPLLYGGVHQGPTLKCGANLLADADLQAQGKLLGRQPFFRLAHQRSAVCYGVSEQYNNWDCIAYDPRQQRFRLWYQQVFAD